PQLWASTGATISSRDHLLFAKNVPLGHSPLRDQSVFPAPLPDAILPKESRQRGTSFCSPQTTFRRELAWPPGQLLPAGNVSPASVYLADAFVRQILAYAMLVLRRRPQM